MSARVAPRVAARPRGPLAAVAAMERTGLPTSACTSCAGDTRAFAFGPFRLHLPERLLHRRGVPVPIGGRAFDILALLVQRAGQIVRHEELVAHVWADVRVSAGTPRVHLTALRKALGCRPDSTRYIVNIPGRGYCFVGPDGVRVIPGRQAVVESPRLVPRGFAGSENLRADWPSAGSARRSFTTGPRPSRRGQDANDWAPEPIPARLQTARDPTSRRSGSHRKPDPALGRDSEDGGPAVNGSPASSGSGTMHQGDNPKMTRKKLAVAAAIALLTCVADAEFETARAATPQATGQVTHYETATIDGLSLFYREAGPPDGPVVVLLHGFPTSSHMFRNLIPTLADRYHVIAPDYPGFGQSAAPDHTTFAYTFAQYARFVDALLQKLGATRYAMYVMDYGAPVGYRLALLHPERVTALIVQNGNAYAEGLEAFWDPIKAYWSDGSETHRRALDFLVAPETTKFQYTDGVSDVSRISPDNWVHDQALLDRPGNRDIQLDLFRDYGTNVPLYPDFQAYLPQQPAADADRLGQERQDISGGRGRAPTSATCPRPSCTCWIPGTSLSRTSSMSWRR